jgi:hypothetical protein
VIPEPQRTYVLELLEALGPAAEEFVVAGAQAMKFMVERARATKDIDFVLDVVRLRGEQGIAERSTGETWIRGGRRLPQLPVWHDLVLANHRVGSGRARNGDSLSSQWLLRTLPGALRASLASCKCSASMSQSEPSPAGYNVRPGTRSPPGGGGRFCEIIVS